MIKISDFPHRNGCSCFLCLHGDKEVLAENYQYESPSGTIDVRLQSISIGADNRLSIWYKVIPRTGGKSSYEGVCSLSVWNGHVRRYTKEEECSDEKL